MRFLFDLLLILTILLWILGLAAQGVLSPQAAGLFLVALVFFVAAIKAGGALSHLIRLIFRVALPICALLTFAILYGKGNPSEMIRLLSSILVLLIMLVGFYVMFRGLFK
jgi:hypothetical protein